MIKANCQRCYKEFQYQPWNSMGKFCSYSCRTIPIKKTKCETCKKEFDYKPYSDGKIRKYCSNKCAVSYNHLSEKDKFEMMKNKFEKNIEENNNGCLIWTGSRFSNGYGRLRFMNKSSLAHRFAYYLYHGNIPDGAIIQHSCDQKNCVSYLHLSAGTPKSNSEDCHSKKRHMYGDKHVHAVLNVEKVKEIKQKLKNGISRRAIAEEYQIKIGTITALALNKTWSHVKIDESESSNNNFSNNDISN